MERKAPADAHTLKEWQQILDEQVYPWLTKPVAGIAPNGTRNYSALAPCHEDAKRSLTISVGDYKPVVAYCHTCAKARDDAEVERRIFGHLIRKGVDPRALRLSSSATDGVLEVILGINSAGWTAERFRLAVIAYVEGYETAPHGDDLEEFADRRNFSRATAFRARRDLPEDHLYVPDSKKACQAAQVRKAS